MHRPNINFAFDDIDFTVGLSDGLFQVMNAVQVVEGLICFLAWEPDGFTERLALDNRWINEAAAAGAAAAVSAFLVPDEGISAVVVAVLDPGASGYRLVQDAALGKIG